MEIVIKIQDKLYDLIKHYERSLEIIEEENDTLEITLMRAIINGTPLPEGHRRLMILSEDTVKERQIKLDFSCQKWISEVDLFYATVAIIEADKESESK